MMPASNLTTFERHTKTFEDLICSSSLAGGLQQQSIYFTAVHILLSLMAFLGNFLILVVKIKGFYIYYRRLHLFCLTLDSFFVISGSTTGSKKTYVVVTCTLHHGFIIIIIFFYFYFDSLSSDNIACSRPSYCKTKCTVNGTIVKAERKKK